MCRYFLLAYGIGMLLKMIGWSGNLPGEPTMDLGRGQHASWTVIVSDMTGQEWAIWSLAHAHAGHSSSLSPPPPHKLTLPPPQPLSSLLVAMYCLSAQSSSRWKLNTVQLPINLKATSNLTVSLLLVSSWVTQFWKYVNSTNVKLN